MKVNSLTCSWNWKVASNGVKRIRNTSAQGDSTTGVKTLDVGLVTLHVKNMSIRKWIKINNLQPVDTKLFIVDGLTESQNPWERMHYFQRMEDKQYWQWAVKAAFGVNHHLPKESKRRVHIIRIAVRLLDDQNVPAGCKYLVDALEDFGHIYKDSRRYTRVTFDQRKCSPDEEEHMEVYLSDWGGDTKGVTHLSSACPLCGQAQRQSKSG
tara:strand:- start:3147 stop:3776 length:630 start_codon:yes stop_codon:yes gene_type:complete